MASAGVIDADRSVLRVANRIGRWAVGTLLAVILLLAGAFAWTQFEAARHAARVEAHRTAHVLATQYSWIFQAGAQSLRRIAQVAATKAPVDVEPHDIREALGDLPAGLQHSLYDAEGRLILTSAPEPVPVNVADRAYFQALRDGAWFVISPMVTERLTGQQVFILARRTGGPGEFSGAATIAIPIETLSEMAEALDFEDGSILSLVHTDGTLLARSPPMDPIDLSDAPLFAHLGTSPNGSFAAESMADGTARIVGYWKMADWPVIAVAALSEASVFAEFWRRAEAELMLFAPLVVALFVMMIWLWGLQARGEDRELALIAANQRADFLMKEIHHRVKNNLQTVMSLVRLERLPAEAKAALLGRIAAMAAVHHEIYSVGAHDAVPARRYLTGVIENVMRSHDWKVTVDTDIADLRLSGDRAMQLGMLVNEAISNAFKHAFRDRRSGHLSVRLAETQPGWLRLTVADDGPGFDAGATEEHMGSRLIEAFAGQLCGTLTRANDGGHRLSVDFPAAPPQDPPGA